MKKTFLLPVLIGLSLAGCNRHSDKLASSSSNNNNSSATLPPIEEKAAVTPPDATLSDQSKSPVAAAATAGAAGDQATKAATDAAKVADIPAQAADAATATAAAATDAAASTLATSGATTPIADRLTEWKLNPDDIRNEVQASGIVVRSRTLGAGEPTGGMDRILVDQIKFRLQSNADVAGMNLEVQVDKDAVTLNGSATSLDQIGHAVALALDTPGISKATSQIKLLAAP